MKINLKRSWMNFSFLWVLVSHQAVHHCEEGTTKGDKQTHRGSVAGLQVGPEFCR